ncbi:gamma-glutamyltransferase [Pelagivirga sediminicola]|uniref:Glutathione hydrolase proenzyme n=1 Tax=Pelagivirga sediminicola TaxID=2170575 RepID=A0A2T7GC87_9RHOB|nr:gamma-glutamyltransferase [Pelagivirga sediminicola]PVA12040.1 gamma-glutamyltransferase [Pelagivirga sediminicola]
MRALSLAVALLAGDAAAQQATDAIAPEIGAFEAQAASAPVQADEWMVVAAHPLASRAGARVLREGGSAADAMVAVQLVLGLVEPQSSGLGGGAFLVWYDAASGDLTTLDGRETAPLHASPLLFQDAAGQPLAFMDAVVGGRSVGVPGTPMLLAEAHARWGRLNWADLFAEAHDHAAQGFEVSPRMAASIAANADTLDRFAATRDYFLPEGRMLKAGDMLKNPAYAKTLQTFAEEGPAPFYTGPIARQIIRAVQSAPETPGTLGALDLAIYEVRERAPVCAPYRGHEVCGMGPPSSGAIAVGQILGTLAGHDLAAMGPDSAEARRLIGDATRLAFADRGRFVADSDYVPVPVKGLLAPGYLQGRAALLEGPDALREVQPGRPEFDHAQLRGDDDALELPSTSHISIVDRYGNALSMTTTIENAFGSRLMAGGFMLNNELTDFSFSSHEDGRPIANRVEPGKRPRSSMAPTIVLRDGAPVLVLGSPGGSQIIPYVANAIIGHLDWGMDVQAMTDAPHATNRFGTYALEEGTGAAALAGPLRAMGYEVQLQGLNSGLHAISLGEGLQGGADPRREGLAIGE